MAGDYSRESPQSGSAVVDEEGTIATFAEVARQQSSRPSRHATDPKNLPPEVRRFLDGASC